MQDFKVTLNECYKICSRYEKKLPGYEDEDLFWEFSDDLVNMAYLIALSDGSVDVSEVTTINSTFNILYDPIMLMKRYGMDYISEDSFLQKIPQSIIKVAKIEKEENFGAECFLKDTRMLYQAMKVFGNIIINCDGERLGFQVVLHRFFIDKIKNYILKIEKEDNILDINNNSKEKVFETEGMNKIILRLPEKSIKDADVKTSEKISQEKFNREQQTLMQIPIEKTIYNSIAQNDRVYEKYASEDSLSEQDISRSHNETGMPDMKKINELLHKVDGLTGLNMVKKEIHNMVNLLLVRKMREKQGLKIPPVSMHLVFAGNPGTGKTTIARMIAEIYKCLGLLETGQLVETDRSGIVAGYMGQTAERVQEIADSAMGGVLFIDEAYTLTVGKNDGDFGQEAIDTLLKIMEDRRENFMVIVAGYTDKMERFLDSNPGLRSRFSKYIFFNDYSIDELYEIFEKYCKEQDYTLAPGLADKVKDIINEMKNEKGEAFGNAREIRNYFERVISNQANRIMSLHNTLNDMDKENSAVDLVTITEGDL